MDLLKFIVGLVVAAAFIWFLICYAPTLCPGCGSGESRAVENPCVGGLRYVRSRNECV